MVSQRALWMISALAMLTAATTRITATSASTGVVRYTAHIGMAMATDAITPIAPAASHRFQPLNRRMRTPPIQSITATTAALAARYGPKK